MIVSSRLTRVFVLLVLLAFTPMLAFGQVDVAAESVSATAAEFDEDATSWAVWLGAAAIGVFGLVLVFLIRRFSFGSRQRPINTDRSAADKPNQPT